jgi:hypothetical protein
MRKPLVHEALRGSVPANLGQIGHRSCAIVTFRAANLKRKTKTIHLEDSVAATQDKLCAQGSELMAQDMANSFLRVSI